MVRIFSSAVKLLAARPARAFLLVRMAFWVVVLSAAVKFLSLPRALTMVSTSVADKPAVNANEAELATAIDALLSLKVFAFKPICWKRAAVLHRYLSLGGLATTIKFGVRQGADDKLDGHAWLEVNGSPILESEPPNYTVTYSFPSSAPFEMELGSLANSST